MKNRSFWDVFLFFVFKTNKTGKRTEHRWENGIVVFSLQPKGCCCLTVGRLDVQASIQLASSPDALDCRFRAQYRLPLSISRTFYQVLPWLWVLLNKNGRWLIASCVPGSKRKHLNMCWNRLRSKVRIKNPIYQTGACIAEQDKADPRAV